MATLTKKEIKRILADHKLWMESQHKKGKRANFDHMDLSDAKFNGADLRGASFRHANLEFAEFNRANLSHADFSHAFMFGTKLQGAAMHFVKMTFAVLTGADLSEADLSQSTLNEAIFRRATLNGANLYSADASGANFTEAYIDQHTNLAEVFCDTGTTGLALFPPEKGSYVGWKIAWDQKRDNKVLVKLLIPASAKRSSATTRKCRASKAKVLGLYNATCARIKLDDKVAISCHSSDFKYIVGQTVTVDDFNTDRWAECSTGIHHFTSIQDAVDYLPFI